MNKAEIQKAFHRGYQARRQDLPRQAPDGDFTLDFGWPPAGYDS
jgi:hypothetical protein